MSLLFLRLHTSPPPTMLLGTKVYVGTESECLPHS